MPPSGASVVMALQFWPRGGSAQVVRYLAPEVQHAGWEVSLVTGSLGGSGDNGFAPEFFAPLPVTTVDYNAAQRAWLAGGDPLDQPVPFHPSFEDRHGAPDRIYAKVSDGLFERQVDAWAAALARAGLAGASVAHLHHLTPINEAVQRLRPDLPQVVSLHGTEMLMLEAIDRGEAMTGTEPWPFADVWAERLRRWAARADRLIVVSETDRTRALTLFDVPPERLTIVPHGIDPVRFQPIRSPLARRLELLRGWLVEEPRGWDESGVVGAVRYREADLAAFADPQRPVLMFVGRFTEPKRLPLLIRAYARARRDHGLRAPLLIWGGSPGEWEGEHPVTLVQRLGVDGVFFTGWHGHDELPTGLGCADVFVSPSVGEAFGQVFLEAMACGLPVIAAASGGPLGFVNTDPDHPNGWLVPADDEAALVDALVAAAAAPSAARERGRRGGHALAQVRAGYSWAATARHVTQVYAAVTGSGVQGRSPSAQEAQEQEVS